MNLRGWEWLILLAIVLLLFGARRLPDLARSVGKSMKIFKSEVKDLNQDTPSTTTAPGAPHTPAPPTTPSTTASTDQSTDDDGEHQRR